MENSVLSTSVIQHTDSFSLFTPSFLSLSLSLSLNFYNPIHIQIQLRTWGVVDELETVISSTDAMMFV
ncbi:hypothetical protein NC653_022386 [Populus alba x Populus x berolinensis]|uniref:Uncharacterized protein n=1 Tax=Populus alba x Populus x berolinensis TaxID=444605 RepID=A0AAD6MF35_9ROSI|nr:hypothetical protein NC653_022379 [Populus alba x Populus x berolinensis]KAJ6984128.1 hypothetical protein NC653_022386 [Populus alba x Populus x berolinensis]